MNRRVVATSAVCAVLAAGAFVGCRGVLGIEPLELVDGGSDGSVAESGVDATSEGSPGEAAPSEAAPGTDAQADADGQADAEAQANADAQADADAGPPSDAGNPIFAACAAEGGNCRPCCKSNFMQENNALVATMIASGCICGTGLRGEECDGSTCTGGGPPTGTCAMCTDNALFPPSPPPSAACMQAATDCATDGGCGSVVQCLQGCH